MQDQEEWMNEWMNDCPMVASMLHTAYSPFGRGCKWLCCYAVIVALVIRSFVCSRSLIHFKPQPNSAIAITAEQPNTKHQTPSKASKASNDFNLAAWTMPSFLALSSASVLTWISSAFSRASCLMNSIIWLICLSASFWFIFLVVVRLFRLFCIWCFVFCVLCLIKVEKEI